MYTWYVCGVKRCPCKKLWLLATAAGCNIGRSCSGAGRGDGTHQGQIPQPHTLLTPVDWVGFLRTTIKLFCVVVFDYKVDLSKIEVIKWLVFEESQRAEAIIQGNSLMRQFLGTWLHDDLTVSLFPLDPNLCSM